MAKGRWRYGGNMKKTIALAALLLFNSLESPGAKNVTAGSATGTAKIEGKEYQIKHSYALGVGDGYWLLLTDVPVPSEAFEGARKIRALALDGKTHGLLITLDAKGKPNPVMILQVTEVTGDLSWQTLELTKLSKETLEGKTSTVSPQKHGDKTYEYNISFKAPVNVMR
jgi:hypothetical protein